MRPLAALLAVLAGPLLVLGAAPAAWGHAGDPRVATVLDEVSPAPPAGVVVQVQEGITAQLVAANPTDVPLEALDAAGRPFLRLSRAGVLGDLGDPAFADSELPGGAATRRAAAVPHWVLLSHGDSWGWYDHRLHPAPVRVPPGLARDAVLGSFDIPLRYGSRLLRVRGHLQFTPLLGGFLARVATLPAGCSAEVLQGALPGLALRVAPGTTLIVLGRDGEQFLRAGPAGLEVNDHSRTWVEDRQARGLAVPPPSGVPAWRALPGRSLTWLDARLRYPRRRPPPAVLDAGRVAVVGSWTVPVLTPRGPAVLAGDVQWLPADPVVAGTASLPGPPSRSGSPLLVLAAALAGLVVAGATAGLVRRRGRGRGSPR